MRFQLNLLALLHTSSARTASQKRGELPRRRAAIAAVLSHRTCITKSLVCTVNSVNQMVKSSSVLIDSFAVANAAAAPDSFAASEMTLLSYGPSPGCV